MDTVETYRRAQDEFDAVVAAVEAEQWDLPSACAGWTVRDVAGHVIWGQRQLRAWATCEDYAEAAGAPGAPRPSVLVEDDPLAVWRAAREATDPTLTVTTLARTTTLVGLGEVPIAAVVTLLTTDLTAHTWDIGHALGGEVRLDPTLVRLAFDLARANVVRRPGFFGPELVPPPESDEQTRMLAFLGRVDCQPVTA
jgi:uncharacterized protein (TIGR03086 family)